MLATVFFRARNSIRAFANTPGLSLALVATIAIGVGSNAIAGGFIAGLAHPRPLAGTSHRVVSIFARNRFSDAGPLSGREYEGIRNRGVEFAWVDALRIAPVEVSIDGQPETATVAGVMPDLAKALNLDLKGGAIPSARLWQTEFEGESVRDAGSVRVNGAQLKIAGIAPKMLEGLYQDRPVDIWIPFQKDAGPDANPDRHDLWVLGSLHPGVSVSDAQRGIGAALNEPEGIEVIPYSGIAPQTAGGLASIVTLLNFIAWSVFLICCINVASLLLGRAFERSGETSLRVALGATRRALGGELLSDSVAIALAGGILGLLFAVGIKRVLPGFLFEEDAERLAFVPPVAALIASAMVCVSITVLAGMLPMLATVTGRPWTVLQREQGTSSTKTVRLRSALAVLQIAFCCALVIFAALLLEGLHSALKTGAGDKLGNAILVTVAASPPPNSLPDYFEAVVRSAKSVRNVAPVAWATQLPGSRPVWQSFRIQPASSPLHPVDLDIAEFSRGDWDQPDKELTAGRMFGMQGQACRIAVADNAAADALSGRATAGEEIFDATGFPVDIIGVVKGSSGELRIPRPTIYFDPLGGNALAPMRGARFRAPAALSSAEIELNVNFVSSGYLQAFGLSLIGGHWFPDRGLFSDPCRRVGVINQEAADLYFGGKPLGAGIIDPSGGRTEIVGIVRSQRLGIFEQRAEPAVFLPVWQQYPLRMTLILRTSNPSKQTMGELRRKIEPVPGHGAAPPAIETLDTRLERTALAPLRIATLIALASALAALTVSMIGVFSIQSHVARERKKVLAIHLAFGAQGWRILAKSLVESGRLVFAGCVAGTLLALALQRVLLSETGLIGNPPLRAWLLALLLPGLAVLVSGGLGAIRTVRVDPMAILHER